MSNDTNSKIRQQFGPQAEMYRDSFVHAKGADLNLMVQSAKLTGKEKVLDIALGAGHTALAFAPFVEKCDGIDVTEEMVQKASELANSRGIENVDFVCGDAENLPYTDSSFDIVTCRYAAHHFSNPRKFVSESARVLKPGGILLLVDQYVPDNPVLDAFINDLELKRDPSHIRERTLSEWRHDFEENHFVYQEISKWEVQLDFLNWVERSATPVMMRQKLIELLNNASPECKKTFHIQWNEQGKPLSFCLKTVLILGKVK